MLPEKARGNGLKSNNTLENEATKMIIVIFSAIEQKISR
jgi:hypothetical protein